MAVAGYEIAAYGAVDAAHALGVAPPCGGGAWRGAGGAVVPQAAMAIAVLAASAASLVDHLGLWNMLPTPPHGPDAGRLRSASNRKTGRVGTRHEYPAAASARKPSTGTRSSSSPILSCGRYARSVQEVRIGLAQ